MVQNKIDCLPLFSQASCLVVCRWLICLLAGPLLNSCLGLLLAPFTAVLRTFLGWCVDFVWVWFVASSLCCCCFLDFIVSSSPALQAGFLLLTHLLGSVPPNASPAICMSTDPTSWSRDLALRDLTRLVGNLATRLDDIERHLQVPSGWWEIVEEERPFGISSGHPPSRFLQIEDGPPEISRDLLTFARRELDPASADSRALRAFQAGFWANAAVVCHTAPFSPPPILRLEDRFWVVLRASGLACPFIVDNQADLRRLLQLPGPRVSPVVQGLPTKTECVLFCVGGGRLIPAQATWRNMQ